MSISQRLNEVLQKIRPEVETPIIVEVYGSPADQQGPLQGMGMRIKYVSKTLPLIYGWGNSAVIQAIASQGFVKEVSYDEPTYAL
jgi:hypothetical protein